MNKKLMLIVMLVIIGALVVSAFSWAAISKANQASLQQGRVADAARYTAMARYYEAQNAQPVDLTGYHLSERNSSAAFALGTNQQGLEIYHQSEWSDPVKVFISH